MTTSVGEKVTPLPTVRRRALKFRWVWIPLCIYAATRLLNGALLAWGSRFQIATARVANSDPNFGFFVFEAQPPDPGVLGVATNWDGQWYQLIATEGYQPAAIDSGPVATRAWAFPPVYPTVVGWAMRAFGWDFALAAVVVSLLCGAVAMVLVYRLAQSHVGDLGAATTVALTCLFVSAPLFQVAYSESMGLALLACSLLLIRRGSYWWAVIPTIVLAFTRIITPPLAVVALAVWLHRRQKGQDRTPMQTAGVMLLVVVSLSSIFYWSALGAVLRGSSEGDRALEMAAGYSFGYFGAFFDASPLAVLLPVCLGALVLRIAWSERERWGVALSSWAGSYVIFVLAVTPPTTGLVRYLLFAFPFAMALAASRPASKRHLGFTAVACVLMIGLQILWVRFFFLVAPVAGIPTLMP